MPARGSKPQGRDAASQADPMGPARMGGRHRSTAPGMTCYFYFIAVRFAQHCSQKALSGLHDAPEVNSKQWLSKH